MTTTNATLRADAAAETPSVIGYPSVNTNGGVAGGSVWTICGFESTAAA